MANKRLTIKDLDKKLTKSNLKNRIEMDGIEDSLESIYDDIEHIMYNYEKVKLSDYEEFIDKVKFNGLVSGLKQSSRYLLTSLFKLTIISMVVSNFLFNLYLVLKYSP